MDTALLLDWAPTCTTLYLGNDACKLPGLHVFARAAPLRELRVSCTDMLAAARADAVLCACRTGQLRTLYCADWYIPGTELVTSISELHVDLGGWVDTTRQMSAPGEHISALLYRLGPLQSLKKLTLSLGADPILLGPEQPLKLQTLWLTFSLEPESGLDLSWLMGQPAEELSLDISISTGDTDVHARLADSLQQLNVQHLYLTVLSNVPPAAQQHWARIKVRETCSVVLREPDMCLVATPLTSFREIELSAADADISVSVDWACLCSTDGTVCLKTFPGQQISITGQTNELCASAEPWELAVPHPDHVVGLPDAERYWEDGGIVFRNKAAEEADWW